MFSQRDSNLPLVVALLVVLAGHAAAVPWASVLLDPQRTPGRASPPALEFESSSERDIELGRQPARTSRVAWIPYDDYRELISPRESPTRQPALQRDVDPVEQAPLELDPTPPAPTAEAPREAVEPTEPDLLAEVSPMESPLPELETDMPGPFPRPTERASDASPTPPAAAEPARPTAAPRGESESILADLVARTHRIQPGRVLTAGELEIVTEQPRFSAVARSSAVPRNPIVKVTFDPDGSVVEVTFERESGYSNVDRPLRTSLHRWRATGPALERIDEAFTLTFEIILLGR